MQTDTSVVKLDINLIIPNKYQPRKVFEDNALESLADSIKQYGIINPILVRSKDSKYEIIAGERRYRAAKKIGLTEVPVIIKNASEQQMAELALIENIQRQGLSPIEEAKSYEEIMRIGNQTQASLANKVGKSQPFIANKIRLLSLPEEVQDALANKKISERHARSLLNITEKEKQLELLDRIINEKLTVKETEQILNENKIDEDEIKQAISDIMKSLNIKENEEQKEEKEDDNMNNGSFFPNFDNNNNMNNNASLNMMNMQSMNQQPMVQPQESFMSTPSVDMQPQMSNSEINPIPSFAPFTQTPTAVNSEPMAPTIAPMQEPLIPTPSVDIQPQMSNPEINPIPSFDQFTQTTTPQSEFNVPNNLNPMDNFMNNMMPQNNLTQHAVDTPQISESQIFGPQFATNNPQTDMLQPEQPMIATPMVDEPLFNPNITMPSQEQPMVYTPPIDVLTNFEVPVMTNEPVVAPQVDKLTELKELLTANGYNYKVYSNDTDNCVIIELPKN